MVYLIKLNLDFFLKKLPYRTVWYGTEYYGIGRFWSKNSLNHVKNNLKMAKTHSIM